MCVSCIFIFHIPILRKEIKKNILKSSFGHFSAGIINLKSLWVFCHQLSSIFC